MLGKLWAYVSGAALPYIFGAFAAALIALGSAYWIRGVELRSARADVKTAKADVDTALRTINSQKAVLKECSDRTDALKAEGDKRVAAAAQELARAQKEASKYQAATKRIEALRLAPSPTGAKCEVALQAIRRELRK